VINEEVKHIVEAELSPGENLLWVHAVEIPRVRKERLPIKKMKWLGTIMQLLSLGLFLKLVLSEGLEVLEEPLLIGLIICLAITGLKMFWSSPEGQAINRSMNRDIFQNGVLTSKRFLMFNNYDSHRVDYFVGDISSVSIDFENGGRALRVGASDGTKDSILVGGVDFEPAASLIRKIFLIKDEPHEQARKSI